MAAYLALGKSYMAAINLTESLPGTIFIIERDAMPVPGEFLAFRWEQNWPYPRGSVFVKYLVGLPGAHVTNVDRHFFVNGLAVGRAKEHARTGEPLSPGPVGTIPPNHFYVAGTHADSLDSRYELTGWISRDQIIGRAYRLF